MNITTLATKNLLPVADALVYISTTKVHNKWFPYVLAPTLHAARISIVYQANARRSPGVLSWGTYIAGYLIMCWGGTLITHFMLGLPPPMLYSFHPYINYLTVHVVFTALFSVFPSLLYTPAIDTILFPLDALLRTNAVTMTLGLLASPTVNPVYVNSPLTHLILGALASAGGGLSAATLSTWTPNWTVGTPPILRAGAGLWGTLDVWGGALVAFIYSSVTSPVFASFSLASLLSSPLFDAIPLPESLKSTSLTDATPISPLGARALAATVFGVLFGLRVLKVHYIPVITTTTSDASANTVLAAKKRTGTKKTKTQ
ncbi:hypothetical protein BDQ12DRAFT_634386 [Crucibulum laeve]|uniref:Uncharacterized protein n=1 Tax=Crucibulum laeve TaxID=68775 RepID=A0A5C3LUS2_9AGAR|nr:hypothetical protein BDQ12DRAFT_634386 [Crucibulum laeve]